MNKILSFSKRCGVFLLKICALVIIAVLSTHFMLELKTSLKVAEHVAVFNENYAKAGNCYVSKAYSAQELSPQKALDQTDEVLSRFPQEVRETIKNSWVFVYTSELPDVINFDVRNQITSDVSGVTFSDIKTIFILTDKAELWEYVLTHEICHAIGYEYGSIDYSSEFAAIYQLYKDSYQESLDFSEEDYATSSQVEFFASALSMYILDSETLRETAPMAYDFMNKLLERNMDGIFIYEVKDSCSHFVRILKFSFKEKWASALRKRNTSCP